MKKILLTVLCLLLSSCANPTYFNRSNQFTPVNWRKVVILPFDGEQEYARDSEDTFKLHLMSQSNFVLVEPPDLSLFTRPFSVSDAQIVGQIAKAEAVIMGNVSSYNNGITMNGFATVKIIDTRTGEVVAVSHKPSGLLFGYSVHQGVMEAVKRTAKDVLVALQECFEKNIVDESIDLPEPPEILGRNPSEKEGLGKKGEIKGTVTGFAIDANGVIITAYHVIESADVIEVKFKDTEWVEAKLLKHSVANDIAILKINKGVSSFLKIGNAKNLNLGDKVFTIGYPVIGVLGEEPKYTEGTISSLSGIKDEDSLLQISVPIQLGNSGGPLVSENGDVVGLITSTAAFEHFVLTSGSLPQNVNWAIKADYINLMLNDIELNNSQNLAGSLVDKVKNSICLIRVK